MHKNSSHFTDQDRFWMQKALALAEEAGLRDEVPVGAVLIGNDEIWAATSNRREELTTPLAHAELLALDQAARQRKSWRLAGSTLYVTLEPCVMCAGGILQARVEKVIFGCLDPKGGAVKSFFQVFDEPKLNHQVEYHGGLYADESKALLQKFFQNKRNQKKQSDKN